MLAQLTYRSSLRDIETCLRAQTNNLYHMGFRSRIAVLIVSGKHMGIRINDAKEVSINDAHEEGVNTSLKNNPTRSVAKGLHVHHIFSRNRKGHHRNDGNPLVHALKQREGFTIRAHWKSQLLNRSRIIVGSMRDELSDFDYCLAIPSSSAFCGECANLISRTLGVPMMDEALFRKKLIGEMLADVAAAPPRMRHGMRIKYTTQLNSWQKADREAICHAKSVDTSIRSLFRFLALIDGAPDIANLRLIVVDDIMSSGSSLLSAREILVNQLGAEVVGVTFLGPLLPS